MSHQLFHLLFFRALFSLILNLVQLKLVLFRISVLHHGTSPVLRVCLSEETDMEKLMLWIFICWALMLMSSTAEQQFFMQDRKLSWDDARKHCQRCFRELVTLTPDNTQDITQRIDSDHWIGLRKNFRSTSRSNVSWSQWANEDPLAFQNWYPGRPVFSSPKVDCCSCNTLPSGVNTSSRQPFVCDAAVQYIEDSCVAMLSYGPWVEKDCKENLPFICYEDRFFGQANVTSVTTGSAALTWLSAPSPENINHYRVEVKGDKELTYNQTDLAHDLINLTAGTHYSVQVFPVKCERDLNPQNVTFYTTPNEVRNLAVTNVTETSVCLSWSRPPGNLDFYLVKVESRQIEVNTTFTEVAGLIHGGCYMFTVLSGVQDKSTWSRESNITHCTKPAQVSKLRAFNNTNTSLRLTWAAPEGNLTGFCVKALNDTHHVLFEKEVNQTVWEVLVTGLLMGTKITLAVTALTSTGDHTVEGDTVAIVSYTAPGPVSDLNAVTEHRRLHATWTPPEGNFSSFTVELLLNGEVVEKTEGLEEATALFDGLKTAANYTVVVFALSGDLIGPSVDVSNFTLPSPPTDARATGANQTSVTFEWEPPENIGNAVYSVKLSSGFWGHSWSETVIDKTSHTFFNLRSGTKYRFQVQTVAGVLHSFPEDCAGYTVTDEMQITLSMLCSSAQPLLCDDATTRDTVFDQLNTHFYKLLGDDILWRLEKPEI